MTRNISMVEKPNKDPSGIIAMIGTLLLTALVLALLLIKESDTWRALSIGALTWAIAFAIKMPIGKVLNWLFMGNEGRRILAALEGVVSALAELGIAAIYFKVYLPHMTLFDVIAVGVGAYTIEVIYLLVVGILRELRQPDQIAKLEWSLGARQSLCIRYMIFIERFTALLGHVGSRGLIYLAVAETNLVLALIPLVTFSFVDGLAVYGHLSHWNWFAPLICR